MGAAASRAADATDLVVFAALSWEAAPVVASLERVSREGDGLRAWRGRMGACRVRVVRTGVGPNRARAAAARVAREGTARWFLATGCAGGLREGLGPGALMVSTAVLDQEGMRSTGALRPAHGLQQWARPHGLLLHAGPFYSVSRPLLTSAQKLAAHRAHGAVAVEMESAAIASVAEAQRIPFVGIRAVLDPVETSVPDFIADGVRGVRGLVGYAVRRPKILGEAGRLFMSRRAAHGALVRFFRAFADHDGMGALDATMGVGLEDG
jgi:nucleoside phosphorylase